MALVRDAAAALVAILARWLSAPGDALARALLSDVPAHVAGVRTALGTVHADLAHRLAPAARPGDLTLDLTLALPGDVAEGLRAVLRVAVRALVWGDGSAGAQAAGSRRREAGPADCAVEDAYAALGGRAPLVQGAGVALSEIGLAVVGMAAARRRG